MLPQAGTGQGSAGRARPPLRVRQLLVQAPWADWGAGRPLGHHSTRRPSRAPLGTPGTGHGPLVQAFAISGCPPAPSLPSCCTGCPHPSSPSPSLGAVSWVDSGPHHEPAHRPAPAPAPAPAGAGPAPRAPEGATWWQHLHMRRPGGRQLLPWRAPPGQGDLWGLGPVGVPLPPKEPRPGVARRDDGRARRLSSAGRPGRDTRNQNRAEAWGRFRSSHLSAFQAA